MLLEHAELTVKVNEAGPREGVKFDHLSHVVGGLEFMGETEHVDSYVTILFVERDDVASIADAGSTPRCPADDECQFPLVVVGGADLLTVHRPHVVVVVLSPANLIAYVLLFGYALMHWVLRMERGVLAMVDVKHWGKSRVIEMEAIEPFTEFKQKTEYRMGLIIVEPLLMIFVLQCRHRRFFVPVQFLIG